MITFIFGIITGIIICIFIIIIDIWLYRQNIGMNRVRGIIKQQLAVKSEILKPKTQKEQDIFNLINDNEKRGKDTPLSEIYE